MKTKENLYLDVSNILKKHNFKARLKGRIFPDIIHHDDQFFLYLSPNDDIIILVKQKPRKYTLYEQNLMIKYDIKPLELTSLTNDLFEYYRQLSSTELSLINGVAVIND